MTRIDAFASEPHFAEHLAPVLAAVPRRRRGRFLCRDPKTAAAIAAAGFTPTPAEHGAGPAIVSATGDTRVARAYGRGPIALLEHGAGQSYGGSRMYGTHGAYAGGTHRDVELFLHPGPHPAARDRAAYPDTPVVVVGSPILDVLPSREYLGHASPLETKTDRPVVAVAFHFDATVAPETRSAFPWIRDELERLHRAGWTILGHGHPRAIEQLATWYARVGIETVRSFAEVCRRADVLVADNTSAMFAFAAKGGRVVVLNPPWYRPEVEHGLRFWEAASVGLNVWQSAELEPALVATRDASPELDARREAALDLVYAYRSGAARRAAEELVAWAA